MIHTIDTIFPIGSVLPAERVPNAWAAKTGRSWSAPKAMAIGRSVDAFVNDSRWVARCPDCAGGELVSRTDPRFMCCTCGNATVGGQWLTVVFPKQANLIETVLSDRPDPTSRHWAPNQSVADLRRENQARGVS